MWIGKWSTPGPLGEQNMWKLKEEKPYNSFSQIYQTFFVSMTYAYMYVWFGWW